MFPSADTLIRCLSSNDSDFTTQLNHLLAFENSQNLVIDRQVQDILHAVKQQGNAALIEYTQRFDHFTVPHAAALEIPFTALESAFAKLPIKTREALEIAAQRIDHYHHQQLQQSWQYTEADGTVLGQKITALDRVGIYVPGGKAAYPSSVLMNAIPAKVAGVGEIIMVVPTPHGERNDLVLAAAYLAGVDRVLTIGGAQAIGALAYGTETITAVDKITGPGNAYVASAKRQVFGIVGIDMIAGPSEILIICDGQSNPDWIAMDLFSQAEHDETAQVILLSPEQRFIDQVYASMAKQLPHAPRKAIIAASLQNRGALIKVKDLDEACHIANRIAPEHLELSVQQPDSWLPKLKHAGAIFIGPYTSEALGDYCAGPNHVLPTAGTARFASPLGVYDFQKRTSLIQVSRAGAQTLGQIAATLADGEGLAAHAASARYRL